MITSQEFSRTFLKQYYSIESDFIKTDEYVSIDSQNFSTFSNQYTKLLVLTCSEIDAVLGVIIDNPKVYGVNNRIKTIIETYPNLKNAQIKTNYLYNDISFVPFNKFTDNESSSWWKGYNLLKHNRIWKTEGGRYNYQQANLKNVLYSLGALYILCYNLSHKLCDCDEEIEINSKLFYNMVNM